MASLGLSEREQAGCRDILELLETEELMALTDTVTNRLIHPENRQGVRIPLRRAAFLPSRSHPGAGKRAPGPVPERGGGGYGPCARAFALASGRRQHPTSGGGGTGPGPAEHLERLGGCVRACRFSPAFFFFFIIIIFS